MRDCRFVSSQFGIEPDEDKDTNPGRYGRQLAAWLRSQLVSQGYAVEPVIPEDWGYCLMCSRKPFMLWVGCGNEEDDRDIASDGIAPEKDGIVWCCFAQVEPAFWQLWFRKTEISAALEKLNQDLREILEREPCVQLL
ncbi:MAG: hypothetical protein LBI31_06805 [Zoogloeaceae bacterium]|nr:hypothetical protein [Zoogloeaceae bacterium]